MAFLLVFARQFTNFTLTQQDRFLQEQRVRGRQEDIEGMTDVVTEINSRKQDRWKFEEYLKKHEKSPITAYSYYFVHLLFYQTQTTEESIP